MELSSNMQGILFNLAGCAYMTYVLAVLWRRGQKAKKILLLILSVLLGALLCFASPSEGHLFPAAVAVFHFLLQFLAAASGRTKRNLQNMMQPIRFENRKRAEPENKAAHSERQAT